MLDEIFGLPGTDEQDYLVAGLSRLIRLRGAEHFLCAPILLPEPAYWPDPVEQRGVAAAVLLRRLLAYAEMGNLGVQIEVGSARPQLVIDEAAPEDDPLHHAAGWFTGIQNDVCHFGIANASLRDEQSLIGTLGHEAAHAYRDYHGLVVMDHDVEEKLTDLTTVYLGFGFFTLQSSFQFKTGHYDERGQRLLYERQTLGYLTPGQLAFLLAVQLAIRKDGERVRRSVTRALAPNHAAALARAERSLRGDAVRLRAELGLTEADLTREPRQLKSALLPLKPASVRVLDHAAEQIAQSRREKVAFRVRSDRRFFGTFTGAAVGFFSFLADVGLWMWGLCLALGALGYWLGQGITAFRCSDCDHGVAPDDDACGFCDTQLVGNIEHINDRLEAEDAYRAQLQGGGSVN